MAKVNYTNIVVGDGRLFADDSRAIWNLDNDVATNGEASQYYMGATQNGVTIAWEPDMVDIEVDQFGDAARTILSKIKVSIKTTLAEATLKNVALAWNYRQSGASSSTSGLYTSGNDTYLNVGISSTYPRERYIRIQGTAPGTTSDTNVQYRTYRNTRCISVAASEMMLSRTENIKFAVDFRVLPDTQYTGKEYGYIVDSATAPYTNYAI